MSANGHLAFESKLMTSPTSDMNLEQFSETVQAIENEIGKVIVGQKDVVRSVLIAVLAGRHALLEGVPGLGKTMLIRTLSEVLDLKFARIQFTPDLMPADIVGTDILEETEDGHRAISLSSRTCFRQLDSRRRNQPRDTQDSIRPSRSYAGTNCHRCRSSL